MTYKLQLIATVGCLGGTRGIIGRREKVPKDHD